MMVNGSNVKSQMNKRSSNANSRFGNSNVTASSKQQEALYNFMNSNVSNQKLQTGKSNQAISNLKLNIDPFTENRFEDKNQSNQISNDKSFILRFKII